MATLSTGGKDLLRTYDGWDSTNVGAGTDPDMYASDAYAEKKVQNLVLGGLSKIVYGGFEHQPDPLIISMKLLPTYNVVLSINLGYVNLRLRKAIIQYILRTNQARIKAKQPILVDYKSLKRAVPEVQYITRMYKTTLIRVRETFPLVEWEKAIEHEGTTWANHYKLIKEGKVQ